MEASNRTRRQPAAQRAPRRPGCSRHTSSPARAIRSTGCGQRTSGALTVAFRVIPLEGPDAEKLRKRQLAVILRLLQRATAEASADALPDHVGPRE
jgi:hypothetical protein